MSDFQKKRKLNKKQLLFVNHYVEQGFEFPAKALLKAGYQTENADQMANRLLSTPHVAEYVERLRNKLANEVEEKTNISFFYVTTKLQQLIEKSSSSLDEDSTESVEMREKWRKTNSDIILRAVAEINKMFGYYAPEKSQSVNVNVETSVQDMDKIKQAYKDV